MSPIEDARSDKARDNAEKVFNSIYCAYYRPIKDGQAYVH